jgi:lysophospholipase L1-like esterase
MITRPSLLWILLLACSAGAASPQPAPVPPDWEPEIAAFEAADAAAAPPKNAILFIGSSSIRLWRTLAEDFPGHTMLNRGFGGSTIADSLRFIPRIVTPYKPRRIVMYAGGNDINNGLTAQAVAEDFKSFVRAARRASPDIPIVYISIAANPARWGQYDRIMAANSLIRSYCRSAKGLSFVDVTSYMLGPDGSPRPELFVEDGLHMNPAGYRLWRRLLAPHLGPPDRP